jgi:hypothetical protein
VTVKRRFNPYDHDYLEWATDRRLLKLRAERAGRTVAEQKAFELEADEKRALDLKSTLKAERDGKATGRSRFSDNSRRWV